MRKFSTENIDINITLKRDDCSRQIIVVQYLKDGEIIEEQQITLSASICKQNFNDANFTQSVINFFIKE